MNQTQAAAVERLIRETAAKIILPRFRRLQSNDVSEKAPGDFVTIVDTEAEHALEEGLTAILPGSIVVGEEAVSRQTIDLGPLRGEAPVWVVDPLDGTGNFIQGISRFVCMVALVHEGVTERGWIYDPVAGWMATAERSGGAWRDRARLSVKGNDEPVRRPLRIRANKRLMRRLGGEATDAYESFGFRCAGQEYVALASGTADLALYSRLFPWDHAAGVLLHQEAGGTGRLLNGEPYDVGSTTGPLLLAPDPATWDRIAGLLKQDV